MAAIVVEPGQDPASHPRRIDQLVVAAAAQHAQQDASSATPTIPHDRPVVAPLEVEPYLVRLTPVEDAVKGAEWVKWARDKSGDVTAFAIDPDTGRLTGRSKAELPLAGVISFAVI